MYWQTVGTASKKNMNYLVEECETDFIMSVRCNRAVARNQKDAQRGNFRPLQELKLGKGAVKLYLKGVQLPCIGGKAGLQKRRWQ